MSQIVIVGAGCFGLSTAYHLLRRGYTSVTVLDRSETLPAVDAASYDINKVVRSSYSDIVYTRLAREAIEEWKDPSWDNTYHESGVLVLGAGQGNALYTNAAYINDLSLNARVKVLSNAQIPSAFPADVPLSSFEDSAGYLNYEGGWAEAAKATGIMLQKVRDLGGLVLGGKQVQGFISEEGVIKGVKCADGTEYRANMTVLATGSWTPSTFAAFNLHTRCIATGQCLVTISLTPEEAKTYRSCPVVVNFSTGFYVFPPTADDAVKVAIHAAGYTNHQDVSTPQPLSVSTPRTITSHPLNNEGLLIPKEAVSMLRSHLRTVYSALGEKPFDGSRMCWYTDTPDGDWLIGHLPGQKGVIVATGGSGHAFKFLPIIGRLVADAIDGTLPPELVEKFRVDRVFASADASRTGVKPVELSAERLCTQQDLLGV